MDYENTFKQFLKEKESAVKDKNKTQSSTSQMHSSKQSTSADEGLEDFRKDEEKSAEKKRDRLFCDFCLELFPLSEILDHAANCGNFDNEMENCPIRKSTPRPSKQSDDEERKSRMNRTILASHKCKNSLLKNTNEEVFFEDTVDENPSHQLYVSRAGRQVKRKVNTEEEKPDNNSDQDFFTQAKKNKTMISSHTKITMDTPCTVQETHTEDKSVKTKKEAAKRSLKNKKRSTSDELMDFLCRQDETNRKKQQEMAALEKSLPNEEEEDMFFNEPPTKDFPKVENDENNKVVSTVTQSTESKTQDFDSEEVVPGTPPYSPILHRYVNWNAEQRRNRLMLRTKENSLSEEKSAEKKRDCPLCGKLFPQSEIEDHAVNCGNFDNEMESSPIRKSTPRPSKQSDNEERKSRINPTNLFTLSEHEDEDSPVKETKKEEIIIRRRLIPSKPTNKRGPKPKNQEDFDKIEVVPFPSSSSSVSKSNTERGQKASQSNVEESKMACPICGKHYPRSEIEDHAASCENFENEDSSKSESIKRVMLKTKKYLKKMQNMKCT